MWPSCRGRCSEQAQCAAAIPPNPSPALLHVFPWQGARGAPGGQRMQGVCFLFRPCQPLLDLLPCCMPTCCREYEARLAASERKVYALTKERDALKRGTDKLSGMDDLVREKDAIIKQVNIPEDV